MARHVKHTQIYDSLTKSNPFKGTSVRNQDIFIIQSGSAAINDNLIELSIMIQACRMGSAKRITAVLPYFPYCKQSKRKGRTCITAKRKANIDLSFKSTLNDITPCE
jgi:N-terminal domain of ribose phosphate pyrophosphokinase